MTNTIILAAGKSKRMKSKKTKVLHKILGKTVIKYSVDLADKINSEKTIVVISQGAFDIENLLKGEVEFAVQTEADGTGGAVKSTIDKLIPEGNTLILYGDVPFLRESTLQSFIEFHEKNGNDLSVMSGVIEDPSGYGRIYRVDGKLNQIVEHIDADENQKKIKEINTGIIIVNTKLLIENIENIRNDNEKKEYYLTDLVEIFVNSSKKVDAFIVDDYSECEGINDRHKLIQGEEELRKRINFEIAEKGVTIRSNSVYIGPDVIIENDVEILANTHIYGNTIIRSGAIIGPNSYIENCVIDSNSKIINSTLYDSQVGENTTVGPYAYLRPNSNVGKDCKIGDFVEVKNSNVGDRTKVSHLSYIGDCDIGNNVNVGCGVVLVNYDGKNKYRSTIGNNSFIGCNSNIISPVEIEDESYIAAGTNVTKKVKKGQLAIGRVRQENLKSWKVFKK